MGQASAGHDLLKGDTFKAIAVKKLAGAVNDFLFYFRAMAGGVRHLKLLGRGC